jgi:hypothetical protein
LNFSGVHFNAPIEVENNIYTARFDVNITRDGRHNAFWRGTLGDLKRDLFGPWLPGQPPSSILLNNSKGFVAGYTGQITSNLVNTFRWGFTRQGIEQPNGRKAPTLSLPGVADLQPPERPFGRREPVHNFRNDLSWIRGSHSFQVGANIRTVRNNRFFFVNTFGGYGIGPSDALGQATEVFDALLANGNPNDDPVDVRSIQNASSGLFGTITGAGVRFLKDRDGNVLPEGSALARKFAADEYEFYGQDSWRIRPSFTLTFGLRWSYATPVWERDGLQVRPTVDLDQWWDARVAGMNAGVPAWQHPLLEFALAGKVNNAPAWYADDKNNFSPRIALAWSPSFNSDVGKFLFGSPGQSSIRLGYGLFFNRLGGALTVSNDTQSAGLSAFVSSPPGLFDMATAPRFSGSCSWTGCTGLPSLATFLVNPPAFGFPSTPDRMSSTLGYVVSSDLKTPYTQNLTFSIQRELPKGIVVDAAYVGTLGRQLLSRADWAQYLNLRDPASGTTFWQAYNQIADMIGPDPFAPALDPFADPIPDIAYIDNIFPNMANAMDGVFGPLGLSNTAAFYFLTANFFAPSWADALHFLDVTMPIRFGLSPYCLDPACVEPGLGNPNNPVSLAPGQVFFQEQYIALPGWRNWGSSNYHSLQLTARKSVGDLVFTANYTFSKAIDNGSVAENENFLSSIFSGQIPNAFAPKAHRARSNYDVRHNFNANWVYQLPFGEGRWLGGGVAGWANQIIGGWQVSGLWIWRSGFPLSPGNGPNWPTNWNVAGPSTKTGPITSSLDKSADNGPNLFSDPAAAQANLAYTRPGDVGSRNYLTSAAFFQVDLGVAKSFKLPWEGHRLQFRWETFNVFNNVNFDTDDVSFNINRTATFGRFFSTAGTPRVMQFALRYEF